jgi:hypothetical protein
VEDLEDIRMHFYEIWLNICALDPFKKIEEDEDGESKSKNNPDKSE